VPIAVTELGDYNTLNTPQQYGAMLASLASGLPGSGCNVTLLTPFIWQTVAGGPADNWNGWYTLSAQNGQLTVPGAAYAQGALHPQAPSPSWCSISYNSSPPPPDPPVQCKAPKLRGKTLARARTALRNAHCKLGKVKRPRGPRKRLVVISQSIHGSDTKPVNTRVNVTLGKIKHQKGHR
jgi:hypothetical protein